MRLSRQLDELVLKSATKKARKTPRANPATGGDQKQHSEHPTVVEYAVQYVLKGKSPTAAAKATVTKLHGYINLMIDSPNPVSIDAKRLEVAIWDRIVTQALRNAAQFRPGSGHIAIGAAADHFRLTKKGEAKLTQMVLARDPKILDPAPRANPAAKPPRG